MKVIKFLRENEKLTQKELAERLGVTRNYISLLERGKKVVSVDLLVKLCEEFNYHPCIFLCRRLKIEFPACQICTSRILKSADTDEEAIKSALKLRVSLAEKYVVKCIETSRNITENKVG